MGKEKAPMMLKGFVSEDIIRCWCPFCRKLHTHGWPKNSTGMQHRIAHCHDKDSPFHRQGYYIKPYTKAELGD